MFVVRWLSGFFSRWVQGKWLRERSLIGHEGLITGLSYRCDPLGAFASPCAVCGSPTGERTPPCPKHTLVTASGDNTLKVTIFICVRRSAVARRLLLVSPQVWDLLSGKCLDTLVGHTSYVDCVELVADGRFVVSAGGDSEVRVWRLSDGKLLGCLGGGERGHTAGVLSMAFDEATQVLATGGRDASLRIWHLEALLRDLERGKQRGQRGQKGQAVHEEQSAARLSADGIAGVGESEAAMPQRVISTGSAVFSLHITTTSTPPPVVM